eukprot:2059387-Amphidinium_carterae.1
MQGSTPSLDAVQDCLASTTLSASDPRVQRLTLLVHALKKVVEVRDEVASASAVLAVDRLQPLTDLVDASEALCGEVAVALRDGPSSSQALASTQVELQSAVEAAIERIAQLRQEQSVQHLLETTWTAPDWDEISEQEQRKLLDLESHLTDAARSHFEVALKRAKELGDCGINLKLAYKDNDATRLGAEVARARTLSMRGLLLAENRLKRLQAAAACPVESNNLFMEFDFESASSLSIAIIVTDKDFHELDRADRSVDLTNLSLPEQ